MVWKKSTDMISATLQHDVGCLHDKKKQYRCMLGCKDSSHLSTLTDKVRELKKFMYLIKTVYLLKFYSWWKVMLMCEH